MYSYKLELSNVDQKRDVCRAFVTGK